MPESKALGSSYPMRIKDWVVDLKPVVLDDWIDFGKVVMIFDEETLHAIHRYKDARDLLIRALKIVTKTKAEDPLPEAFHQMDQYIYSEVRKIIIDQNGLDFSYLKEVVDPKSKKAEPLP